MTLSMVSVPTQLIFQLKTAFARNEAGSYKDYSAQVLPTLPTA
jgi:hypothetical protein